MRTDYQNINGFESLTIIFVVVGLLLTSTIIFASLAPKQQANFAVALDILDARQQAVQTLTGMKLVYDSQQEFFDQFYFAFTQVAVISPDIFKISFNYQAQASGQVLGETVDRGDLTNIIPPEVELANNSGPPVDWQALKQNLVKLYKPQ